VAPVEHDAERRAENNHGEECRAHLGQEADNLGSGVPECTSDNKIVHTGTDPFVCGVTVRRAWVVMGATAATVAPTAVKRAPIPPLGHAISIRPLAEGDPNLLRLRADVRASTFPWLVSLLFSYIIKGTLGPSV